MKTLLRMVPFLFFLVNQLSAKEILREYLLLNSDKVDSYKFPSSCNTVDNSLPLIIPLKENTTEHYFFFSLSKYLSEPLKQKHEFRFFKNFPFQETPDFILNEAGLWKNKKLVCEWKLPYSEDLLYANYLKDCFVDELSNEYPGMLDFYNVGHQHDYRVCGVFNVKSYSVKNGVYTYKSNIYGNDYYLDTRDMPELANGRKFLSKEKRSSLIKRIISEREKVIRGITDKIKISKSFSELQRCISSNQKKCTEKFWDKKFYQEVAEAGFNPICHAGRCGNFSFPKCGDFSSFDGAINKAIRTYLMDFILSINNSLVKNFDFSGEDLIFKIPSPHTRMHASFRVETNGKLRFYYFADGDSC